MTTHNFYRCFFASGFGILSPKPNDFDAIEPNVVLVLGIKTNKTSLYKPRGFKWVGVKPTTKRTLRKNIDVEKNYNFISYSNTASGV